MVLRKSLLLAGRLILRLTVSPSRKVVSYLYLLIIMWLLVLYSFMYSFSYGKPQYISAV